MAGMRIDWHSPWWDGERHSSRSRPYPHRMRCRIGQGCGTHPEGSALRDAQTCMLSSLPLNSSDSRNAKEAAYEAAVIATAKPGREETAAPRPVQKGTRRSVSIAPPLGGTRDRVPPARGTIELSPVDACHAATRQRSSPNGQDRPTGE